MRRNGVTETTSRVNKRRPRESSCAAIDKTEKDKKEPDNDKRGLDELYKEAQEILDEPVMTAERYRQLVRIKRRVEELIPIVRKGLSTRRRRRKDEEDYVPYPSVLDPDFNDIVSSKREFAQGTYPRVDTSRGVEALWDERCRREGFMLSLNQQMLRNFVSPSTPYNGLLLFHGVGVGKTCAAITIAEQFPDKKVAVLVQPGQKSYFRNQVFDFGKLRMTDTGVLDVMHASEQCTGTHYLRSIPDAELTDRQSVEHHIRRLVKARYAFLSTHNFAKQVHRIMAGPNWEQQLRRKYSNHVVVVDEAHHLRLTNSKDIDSRKITMALRNVVKYAEGVKLLLLTATPMFNEASDVMELVNLLLLNDKRRPLRDAEVFDRRSGVMTDEGARVLKEATRGYVSYMRGDDPFSFPLRLTAMDNKDPAAMPPDDPRQPTHNIKGELIPSSDRFSTTILTCSDLSPLQARVYSFTDRVLRTAAVEDVDEDKDKEGEDEQEDGDVRVKTNTAKNSDKAVANRTDVATMRLMAMGICNIVYPVPASLMGEASSYKKNDERRQEVAARLSHGRVGFDNAFVRLPGQGLRVRYAGDHVPRFLANPLLSQHAPKMKTVIDRIVASEGIVFVYSQYIPSGLMPFAIALEHEGFSRYGQSNLLEEDSKIGRSNKGRVGGRGWTYVALTGDQDFSSQYEREVEAVRHRDNADGSSVKVVLASSKASEGLDLRNIREVHVMDPWFHFNKTEQIVGRAARNCSHADLPVEKRNVTVYLHAARFGTGNESSRETIDVRAYRIAENKHRRVRSVEELLVENSIDCQFNRQTQYHDPTELNLRTDVLTSQGVSLRQFPMGDRPPRRRLGCVTDRHDERGLGQSALIDGSTYDASEHVGGVQACKSVFMRMFRRGIAFTVNDIREECRRAFPTVRDEAILMAIEEVLDERVIVKRDTGADGYVLYASDKYIFQDLDAFDERSGLEDRRQKPLPVKTAVVFRNRSRTVSSPTSTSTSSKGNEERHSDGHREKKRGREGKGEVRNSPGMSVATMTIEHAQAFLKDKQAIGLLPASSSLSPSMMTRIEDVILDYTVDRLDRRMLIRLIQEVVIGEGDGLHLEATRKSLERGHALSRTDGGTFYMYDYYAGKYACFDGSGKLGECMGILFQEVLARDTGARLVDTMDHRRLKGYVLHSTGSEKKDLQGGNFKLMGVSEGSSGCVCSQTSNIKVQDMERMIGELSVTDVTDAKELSAIISSRKITSRSANRPVTRAATRPTTYASKKFDKKNLCMLYEVMLRLVASESFARPAIASRVFRQKGKRMMPVKVNK